MYNAFTVKHATHNELRSVLVPPLPSEGGLVLEIFHYIMGSVKHDRLDTVCFYFNSVQTGSLRLSNDVTSDIPKVCFAKLRLWSILIIISSAIGRKAYGHCDMFV